MTVKITQIRLLKTTRERLRKHGIKGDSWDKIINQLLDFVENITK